MAILVFSPNGTHVAKPTLEAARTSADCAGKTVVVTSALTAAQSDITAAWPADRALEVKKGGSIGNTVAFTINGPFYAESYQVFSGAGVVTFGIGAVTSIKPEWFGAYNDGTHSTETASGINKAAVAAVAAKGVLEFSSGGHYLVNSPINITGPIDIKGNRAQLHQETANLDLFFLATGTSTGVSNNMSTMTAEDLILGTAVGTGTAWHMRNCAGGTFKNITVVRCGYGFRLEGSMLNSFVNCRVGGTMAVSPGYFMGGYDNYTTIGFYILPCPLGYGYQTGSNGNTFTGCYAQGGTISNYYLASNNTNSFFSCDSETVDALTGTYHYYADSEIGLRIISGVHEGNYTEIHLRNCNAAYLTGLYVNNAIRIDSGCHGVLITGCLVAGIYVLAGAVGTTIDGITLVESAGNGITNSGTGTKIGCVYDRYLSSFTSWSKDYEASFPNTLIVDVGGTRTGHTITRNDLYVKRMNNGLFVDISIEFNALAGTGLVTIDMGSLGSPLVGRRSALSVILAQGITLGIGFYGLGAFLDSDTLIRLLKLSGDKTVASTGLTVAEMQTVGQGIYITGFLRYF